MACDRRYQVNSIPLETDKTLPTLSGPGEVFQHHNMQLAVYLCDPSGRGPFTPCNLKGPKDGPTCKDPQARLMELRPFTSDGRQLSLIYS